MIRNTAKPGYTNGDVSTEEYEDSKKRASRISAEAPAFVMPPNVYGTYYFNGTPAFLMDSVLNIKESIKKQMWVTFFFAFFFGDLSIEIYFFF